MEPYQATPVIILNPIDSLNHCTCLKMGISDCLNGLMLHSIFKALRLAYAKGKCETSEYAFSTGVKP